MRAVRYIPIIMGLLLTACSPKVMQPQPLPVEAHRDTITVVKEVVRDSIIHHYTEKKDSSSFRQNGDTVTIERWHWERDYRYEKILQAKIDSLSQVKADSIPYPVPVEVPVPAELTRWQKAMMNLGGAALYLIILGVGYIIVRLLLKFK